MLKQFFNSIFQFNLHNIDQFVAEAARSLPQKARVLDAGAGSCRYKTLFLNYDYKTQDFGQYKGDEHKYGELDYVCEITSIPVENASFDALICIEVLEHLPRPDLAIREFSRILKPGGKIFITAPLGSGIHQAPYHFYGGFTPSWYQKYLTEYGFEIESIRPNGGFFKNYGQETQRFLTMITPRTPLWRASFMPLKAILALWFRLLMPLVCHWLDRFDGKKDFTVGYFVIARKKKSS